MLKRGKDKMDELYKREMKRVSRVWVPNMGLLQENDPSGGKVMKLS